MIYEGSCNQLSNAQQRSGTSTSLERAPSNMAYFKDSQSMIHYMTLPSSEKKLTIFNLLLGPLTLLKHLRGLFVKK